MHCLPDGGGDEEPVPTNESLRDTYVPHHEAGDFSLIRQSSSRSDSDDDHQPSDEGPRCWRPMRQGVGHCFNRGGATCPSKCPIKHDSAAGVAQLAGTTSSCLRFNDADPFTDAKSWLRSALSPEHDLMTKFSETGELMVKTVQHATASLGAGMWAEAKPPVSAVDDDYKNQLDEVADFRKERQRITGSICIAVRYVRAMALVDDIRALTVGRGGRVFVADMAPQGPAFHRGVRPGDELVRIRIGNGVSRVPDASPQALRQLAMDPSVGRQFCEAYFMGFAGQFPAEVSVATVPEFKLNLSGTLGSITDDEPFSVPDYAAFRPSCNSLLLASKPEEQRSHAGTTDTDHGGGPWHLIEVKRPQARRLLAGAILLPRPSGCEDDSRNRPHGVPSPHEHQV